METAKRLKKMAYFLCLERGSYRIDLQVGKVYRTAKRLTNDPSDMVRLIDDSGEDYLYPSDWFVPVELPPRARRKLAAASV
jgi:hypothetical protein